MAWALTLLPSAIKDLESMTQEERQAILIVIYQFGLNPSSVDLKKLQGEKSDWRVRVGRWRIIATMEKATGVIQVKRVLPRDKAYR